MDASIQTNMNEIQMQHDTQIAGLNKSHGHLVQALEKDKVLKLFLYVQDIPSIIS